jgi:hypothetical protein
VTYSTQVMIRARKLHAAGWKASEIPDRLFAEFGVKPASTTVLCWVDPLYQRKQRESTRRKHRREALQTRLAMMRTLRERKLSFEDIGQVMAVVWGEELSAGQVKTRLEGRTGYKIKAAA